MKNNMQLIRQINAILIIFTIFSTLSSRVFAATFTLVNNCDYTVWPGTLSNPGMPILANGGFKLEPGESKVLSASPGWSGRFWGRTVCNFTSAGQGKCLSGDCANSLECKGAGGQSPATLAEFTLGGGSSPSPQDFYDVSLVDGYNLPMAVTPKGGKGDCHIASCPADFNGANCPDSLQVVGDGGHVVACKSACLAFQSEELCCSGAYANPTICKASTYSKIFKAACPHAYSYAFDDPTSTFTCNGAQDYTIMFCPNASSNKCTAAAQIPSAKMYNLDSSNTSLRLHAHLFMILLLLFSTWIYA